MTTVNNSVNVTYPIGQNSSQIYAADSGAANAYVVTLSPVQPAYVAGLEINFKATNANTTASTVNVNGLGVKNITKNGTSALVSGDIAAGQIVTIIYDGTQFQLANPVANSGSGSVTSVATGTGLRGGTITTTGTINLATQNAMSHRLTLVSATPVPTTDQTAATTLYLTPYKGTDIDIYSGSVWTRFQQTELSITNTGLAASSMHDVFIQYNSGTPQLSLLVWTNNTTRATALAYQNGILVLSGTTTSRYLGSLLTDSSSKFTDSANNRELWNYYNRVQRPLSHFTSDASWTYATNTWRQANASSANQVNFVVGVAEDSVIVTLNAGATINSNQSVTVGIGLNSTTAPTGATTIIQPNYASLTYVAMTANLNTLPVAGFNYAAWLENTTNTVTFYGTILGNTGLIGSVLG